MSRTFLLVLLAVLLLPLPALAGQLAVVHYGLAEVVRSPGVAVLGTLLAVDQARGAIRLLVKRVWGAPGQVPMLQASEPDANGVVHLQKVKPEVGKPLDAKLYLGVVWDDPHKSPLDHRLRGALRIEELAEGREVLLLGREAVAPTAEELAKVELFFGGLAGYPAKADAARLERDLGDFDLAELAAAELQRRGALRPAALLRAEPVERSPLYSHWSALDDAGRRAFLSEAAAAPLDAAARVRAARLIEYEVKPAYLEEAAAVALRLDPADADQARLFASLSGYVEREALAGAAFGAATSRALLRLRRPADGGDDARGPLLELLGRLPAPGRAALVDALFAEASSELEAARTGAPPVHLLGVLLTWIAAHPEATHARRVAALPLESIASFPLRTGVALWAVSAAVALARHDPATIPLLKPSLERLLRSEHLELGEPVKSADGELEMQSGILLSVESQLGGEDVETYRRLFRGQP